MRILFAVLLSGLVYLLTSCDPCRNLDCLSSNFDGQFRIISAATGNDLVFGPARVYDKARIRFFTLGGTDTSFLEYRPIRFPGMGYDSILLVRFFPPTPVAYMQLSNGDVDTLNIFYRTRPTKCCGTITEITDFQFNNIVTLPGDAGTQDLKK